MKKCIVMFALACVVRCYGMDNLARKFSTLSRERLVSSIDHSKYQELYLNYAKELVAFLRTNEPELLRLMDEEEEEDADMESCFGDEDGYSKVEALYSEVRRKWNDLKSISGNIYDQTKREAILSLFTLDEKDRNYNGVIEVLRN